jgi:hypothetical protein
LGGRQGLNGNELVARMALTVCDKKIAQYFAIERSQMGFKIKAVTLRGVLFSGHSKVNDK